ncbi:MFS transporter [Kitasatospora sp. NBC_00240]|uniref:MFS transporter n=1 Tax=Kitasatospora sp. NBC_00240 TaxID=2903567 RepID=UPI002251C5EF|nr:MFS transporter [Kitasatospora sp. NBC_00240]MCX5210442.1 MFS transporter [Kitasatospora sp. NBC_00240]
MPAAVPPTPAAPLAVAAPAPAPAAVPSGPAPSGPAPSGPPATAARRGLAKIICLVTILLAVLDMNIVSAATVPIVRDLDPVHGVDRLPWLVSAFALAATALLPLYGKLCDLYGAKRVFLGAVATFLAGSALCGAAGSMDQLIAFRALQGIGGGGLMSVTMVVMAQLREPGDEGGGGSIGGIVGGAGMAVGPLIGALLADHFSWRWIFYVNLPVGLFVLAGAAFALKLPHRTGRGRLDFLGATLAAAFATGLLLVTEWGGKEYAWSSTPILLLGAGTLAALGLFLHRQATAAEPVLPLSLFRIPALRTGFAVQGLVGMGLMGSVVYVMLYLQVARGVAATSASLFLIPMAAGMTAVGLLVNRLSRRGRSPRTFLVAGAGCSALALLLLGLSGPDTGLWTVRAELALLGVGFGQLVGQLIGVVQDAAPAHQLGVATTAVRFFQTLGGALGAALFGTVLARVFGAAEPGTPLGAVATLAGAEHEQAVRAFVDAADVVFLSAGGLMVLAMLLALRLRPVAGRVNGSSAAGATGVGQNG